VEGEGVGASVGAATLCAGRYVEHFVWANSQKRSVPPFVQGDTWNISYGQTVRRGRCRPLRREIRGTFHMGKQSEEVGRGEPQEHGGEEQHEEEKEGEEGVTQYMVKRFKPREI